MCFHHRFVRGGLREEDRIAAIQHARAAIAHGSDDATALAVAAHVIALVEHDTVTRIKLFDRALELSNSNVFALSLSAIALAWMGKAELAIERAERAIRLSPFDSYNFRSYHALAITYFYSQQYQDAVDAARRASITIRALASSTQFWRPRCCEPDARRKRRQRRGTCWNANPPSPFAGSVCPGELEPAVFGPFADAWREIGLPE